MVEPGDRKYVAAYLQQSYEISITRACKSIGLSKSVYYYTSVKDDTMVIHQLEELAQKKPIRGFPYYFNRLNILFLWYRNIELTVLIQDSFHSEL